VHPSGFIAVLPIGNGLGHDALRTEIPDTYSLSYFTNPEDQGRSRLIPDPILIGAPCSSFKMSRRRLRPEDPRGPSDSGRATRRPSPP
jgi:hypothetical protein